MDFTVSADRYDGLGEFVDELKNNGTHYIIILVSCVLEQTNLFTLNNIREIYGTLPGTLAARY